MSIDVACRSGYIRTRMESALTILQENFRAKSDDELLSLTLNAVEMTPESRFVLIEELLRRIEKVKDHPVRIRLVHGWHTVFVERANIRFPSFCPKCLERKSDTGVSIASQAHRKSWIVYVKHDTATLQCPFCWACADRVKWRTRLISWPSYALIASWFLACWLFGFGRLVAYFGALLLSLPMTLLIREGAAVKLGDFGPDWIECRFQSARYAEEFASLNRALETNTENIQQELELAIKAIQRVESGSTFETTR